MSFPTVATFLLHHKPPPCFDPAPVLSSSLPTFRTTGPNILHGKIQTRWTIPQGTCTPISHPGFPTERPKVLALWLRVIWQRWAIVPVV